MNVMTTINRSSWNAHQVRSWNAISHPIKWLSHYGFQSNEEKIVFFCAINSNNGSQAKNMTFAVLTAIFEIYCIGGHQNDGENRSQNQNVLHFMSKNINNAGNYDFLTNDKLELNWTDELWVWCAPFWVGVLFAIVQFTALVCKSNEYSSVPCVGCFDVFVRLTTCYPFIVSFATEIQWATLNIFMSYEQLSDLHDQ